MTMTAITMPKWGLTMTEGKVVQWLKPQGAAFAPGEELLEIETSKITNVVEAESDGVLARIVAAEGSTLPIGALLAVVAPADTPAAEIDAFVSGFAVVEPAGTEEAGAEPPAPQALEVAGCRLRYLQLGSGGTPVVLLHGFGGDLNTWMFNQPVLAERQRTIALELPGHGESSKEVGAGDPDALAATMESLLDALDIKRAHLVGHSMGGAVAALVAARRPHCVASLTLIAPAGLGPEINGGFIDGFVHASRRKDVTDVLRQLVHDPSLVSRTMVEDVLRYKRLDGVAQALESIAAAWFPGGRQACDVIARVTALQAPVQVVWGREDKVIPVVQASALAARVPVHVIDHAGHLPHMERAAEVNRLIRAIAAG